MKTKYGLVFLLCLICSIASAQNQTAPVTMLQQTSDQMLNALKQNKPSLKGNSAAIYRIVDKILLPQVDLESMSRSVVGRNYWAQATPAQKAEFKKLFTYQVTQTYSTALSSYQNEKIKFYPIRGYNSNEQRVQVQSVIIRGNGQTIPVSYRLVNNGGNWKVYDFSVEGVSLISSYQAQFANDLSQGGMAGLLAKMRQRYGH